MKSVVRLSERYRKFRLYSFLTRLCTLGFATSIIVLIAAFEELSAMLGDAGLGVLGTAGAVSTAGILVFGGRLNKNALSLEEIMIVQLSRAIPDLEEYVAKRNEALRSSALSNLERIMKTLRRWDYGNLSLTERLVGKSVKELREVFEKNVLSSVRTGDEQSIRKVIPILQVMQSSFSLDNYDLENLERWSMALRELPGHSTSKAGILKSIWLTTPRRVGIILVGSTVAAIAVHLVAMGFIGATKGEALVAASTVFAGLFAGLSIFAYLKS